MEWTIAEFDNPNRIVATVRGLFTIKLYRIGMAELAARKDPLTPALFDHRELDFSRTSTFDLMEMDDIFKANKPAFSFSKIAVLVTGEIPMKAATKWQRVAQGSTGGQISIFATEPEALDWLREN